MRSILRLALVMSLAGTTAVPSFAATYTWITPGGGSFLNPFNWSPNKFSGTSEDVLIFTGATGTVDVSQVPSGSAGRILVQSGAIVRLTSTSSVTIAITGLLNGLPTAEPDLVVEAGAEVVLQGSFPMQFQLSAPATGMILGTLTVNNAAHKLMATSEASLKFEAGALVRTQALFTGNLFGSTNLNTVSFEQGSVYEHGGGGDVFGATPPDAVVVFEPGSLFRLKGTNMTGMNNRTFANFEYDVPGPLTGTSGGGTCTVDSITVKSGTFVLGIIGGVSIRGSVHVYPLAKLLLGSGTGTPARYTFNGETVQNLRLDNYQEFWLSEFDGLLGATIAIDNPAGVNIVDEGPALSCTLEFVRGNLRSTHPLASIFMFGTANVVGASQSTGWIEDNFMSVQVRPSSTGRVLPLGDATTYMPLTLQYHGLSDSLYVGGGWQRPEDPFYSYYPYFFMAGIDSTQKVDVQYFVSDYYFISQGVQPRPYSSFDATLTWSPEDVDPGADASSFALRMKSYTYTGGAFEAAPYTDQAVGARTSTSIQGVGLAPLNPVNELAYVFTVGEPATLVAQAQDAATVEGEPPALRVSDAVLAGNELQFHVSLAPAPATAVQVDYEMQLGTADAGDFVDPTATSGTLTFVPGDTVETVAIPVSADEDPERHETVQFVLSNCGGCDIGAGSATGTLEDDDDVTPPTVTVTTPNGGEAFEIGTVVNLQWTATDDVAVNSVTLRLTRDGNTETIAENVPNTGTYAWTSTGPQSTQLKFRVAASDDPGNVGADASDGLWTLGTNIGVEDGVPVAFSLSAPAPNPLRGHASIGYALPHAARVDLAILDVRGRRVATLVSEEKPAGRHVARWSALGIAPGLYFANFTAPGYSATQRLIVLE